MADKRKDVSWGDIEATLNIVIANGGIDALKSGHTKIVPVQPYIDGNEKVVTVKGIKRASAPKSIINDAGRTKYVTGSVQEDMPCCEKAGASTELVLFKIGKLISGKNLAAEYEKRGLVPDPFALAKYNQDNPEFADDHPNATQWVNKEGKHCYAAFGRWRGERSVDVCSDEDDWDGGWWFAGRRKN